MEGCASDSQADQFTYLVEENSALSTVVAGHEALLSVLRDDVLLTRCQMYEEGCGRINVDNLNRFLILGAPFIVFSAVLQDHLKQQVSIHGSMKTIHIHQYIHFLACIILFVRLNPHYFNLVFECDICAI